MILWTLKRKIRYVWEHNVFVTFILYVVEIVVTFFTQTLKAHISLTDWPIDLIFCTVTSFDLFYWCVMFKEISDSVTTQTSLPTKKF